MFYNTHCCAFTTRCHLLSDVQILRIICMLLVLITFKVTAAENLQTQCETLATRADNQVITAIPDIVVDEYSHTSDDLAFLSGFHNDNWQSVGGVTSAIPLVKHEVVSNMALLPNGQGVCVRPAINVTVGYQTMSIFMENEIPRQSCIYNAIFAHEMHHVSIFKDYLVNHQQQIKQSVNEKFDGRAYYFKTIFEAKQYIEILGDVFIQHLKQKFIGEVNIEQAALDTQAEYSRMQMECLPAGHRRY